MRIIALVLMFCNCYCFELGNTKLEEFKFQEYIADGKTTYDQKDRIKEALMLLDVKMDEIINKYKTRIDEPAKILLSESQTKWKEYAMARCAFLCDKYRGGTLQGVNHGACLVEMTRLRILDLMSYEKIYFSP